MTMMKTSSSGGSCISSPRGAAVVMAAAMFLTFGTTLSRAEDKIPITISYQPATWWSLPIYVAEKNGYFNELGLNVSTIVYPSGAPQVAAAVANQTWDIGAAGSVPCIIGGTQGLVTGGISNNEGGANVVIGLPDAAWPFEIVDDSPIRLAVTPNSTGHYAFNLCLESIGVIPEDHEENFIYGQQGIVMDVLEDEDAQYGGLWAPNVYSLLEEVPGSKVLCSGDTVGAPVPGGIMIRKDFGEEQLETVKKALAAWMRAIGWIQNPANRDAVLSNMATFYATFGVELSNAAMNQEIDTRPLFNLEQQLQMMDRGDDAGSSTLDVWFNGVAEFMFAGGVIPEIPASNGYISDEYMKAVYDDEELRVFSMSELPDDSTGSNDGTGPSGDSGDDPGSSSVRPVCGFFGMVSSLWSMSMLL